MKLYGNIINRFEEGRTVPEIKPGMDITMYHWSDRSCYYVVDVINQKRILVNRYYVCGNHSKTLGMGHQDWLYFKTYKEYADYLRKIFPDQEYPERPEDEPRVWVFRYGNWYEEYTLTKENYCTERELKSLKKNGYYKRYSKLEKVSFGVRNYYYDYEF